MLHAANALQFGMYILFPIGTMYYFGTNLDNRFSVQDFWPKPEETNKIPYDRDELQKEFEIMKRELTRRKIRRLEQEAAAQPKPDQTNG